ncbi:SGNH/GDSL hydrolase family protein [Weizmannia ginsengihumi]|nr:SGNH/GDSL hydrolase family protein [Heyndrickxia ginsengihumi]
MLTISGCSAATFKSVSSEQKKIVPVKLHIVSVGDSLTEGIGDSKNRGGYTYYLKHELNSLKGVKDTSIQNFGVKGNTTDQLLAKLQESAVKKAIKQSDLVIITIGGNDIMKVFRANISDLNEQAFKNAIPDYKKHLSNVFTTIRKENPNAKIALVGIYNPFSTWFSDIKEMNTILNDWNNTSKQVTKSYKNTTFIPVADIFAKREDELLYEEDHFHPNNKGYDLMSQRIFQYLLKDDFLRIPH